MQAQSVKFSSSSPPAPDGFVNIQWQMAESQFEGGMEVVQISGHVPASSGAGGSLVSYQGGTASTGNEFFVLNLDMGGAG